MIRCHIFGGGTCLLHSNIVVGTVGYFFAIIFKFIIMDYIIHVSLILLVGPRDSCIIMLANLDRVIVVIIIVDIFSRTISLVSEVREGSLDVS